MVTSICQDKDGFVWIGTEYGLNRFDGIVFTHYFSFNSTLLDNNVSDVFADRDGDLFVITGKALQMYDRTSGLFRNVSFPQGHVPVLSDIAQLHDGTILLLNSKNGLWWVDKETLRAEKYDESDRYLGNSEIHSLTVDRRGRVWVCTNNDGLFRFDPSDSSALHVYTDDSHRNGVNGITEMPDGTIYVLGRDSFYRFDEDTESLVKLFAFGTRYYVRRLYSTSKGQIFVGTHGYGFYEVDLDSGCLVRTCEKTVDMYGLRNTGMHTFMEDTDGNLWLGFNLKGVLFMTSRPQDFRYNALRDLVNGYDNFLTAFHAMDDGRYFVGQSHGGLYLLDEYFNLVRVYMKGSSPISVCKIDGNRYWVGDFSGGASILDLETGSIERVLHDKRVMDFAYDSNGNVYMAVFNGNLTSFTPDGKVERKLGDSAKGGLKLHGRYLNSLLTDSRGFIWIGHYYGFNVYNPENDKVVNIKCDQKLRRAIVYDMIESYDGVVWLATSHGLFGYDRSCDGWIHKSSADGLSGDIVCSIQEAGDSTLWLGTYRGLIHYDRDRERFSYYLNGNGMQEIGYARGIASTSPDGRMYFGNNYGVTSFHPEKVSEDPFIRPLKSVALIVGDKARDIVDNNIELSHKERTFALRFSTMDFRDPHDLSFEYMISSSDDAVWRRTPAGYSELDFYDMDYGQHTLKVRAVYNEARSEVMTMTIRIRPPWYLSVLAKIIYSLFAAAFVLIFWAYWKSRKLAEMNEEKIRFFIDVSHEIRSPLTLIKTPLDSIINEPHDDETVKALRTIQRNTDRLLHLVTQILSIRKMEKGQMKMHYARTDLVGFIKDYVQDYDYTASKRNIDLSVTASDGELTCWIDREHFGKVISNLVSNALKYVDDGGVVQVSVSAVRSSQGSVMEIRVKDNGHGLNEQQIRHLFERFYQVTSSHRSSAQMGFGIGLNLSSQIVRQHGGEIQARNRQDARGSEFIVTLPAGNAHLPAESIVSDDYYVREKSEQVREDEPKSSRRRGYERKKTNYRVVVVDDDEDIRNYLQDELRGIYHVSVYPDGRQALEAVSSNPPDLVISDVSMPLMDGFTLLKRMKGNTATTHVPVVMLTTKVGTESRIEGYEYGAEAYVDKPFDIVELKTVVASLIENRVRMKGKISGVQEQSGVLKPIEMKGNDEALMERIMASVNRRLCDSEFNVEALAAEVGLSRVQLHRRVKEITGITVGEFLRNLRMKQAAELLAKGDVSVSQVTYAVGMSNPTHFTTAFKKYYGITPTEYLNKHN